MDTETDTTQTETESPGTDEAGYAKGVEIGERYLDNHTLTQIVEDWEFWTHYDPADRFGQRTRRGVLDVLESRLETL